MAIGTVTIDVFEKEDLVDLTFTATDPRITDMTGWTITLVIKQSAVVAGVALLGASPLITGTASGLTCTFTFNANLAAGEYTYSVRRTDSGNVWQLAQGTFKVEASAHVTHS